jgi:CPA2 family monovalent cation:H+ antiporter-2
MRQLPFLADFVIILAAAVFIIFVSRPLKLPGIIGFLLTGIIIGPSGLNFISNKEQIEVFAELGVVMLLFFIGLEFSLAQLRAIRRQFFFGGSLQVGGTILVSLALFSFSDFSLNQKIFFGCLIALSSTAIVLKMLSDQHQLDSPHGKLAIGISLFQDFCIVPMVVFTPLLAGSEGISSVNIILRFALSIAVVIAVFFVARFVMPNVLHHIARTNVRESFLLGSLVVCLLLALATASLGFSYALGAFLAGLIISESEYSHEVVAEIVSFRDLFTSLFFISVGMLLDMNAVVQQPLTIFGIGFGIVLLKVLVLVAVGFILRYSIRATTITAVSLAQIGEFSFVLAQVGLAAGLLNQELFQHVLSASIFTMVVTPPVIAMAPWIGERTQNIFPLKFGKGEPLTQAPPPLTDHVIIVGYGLNGQNVVRVLRETGIPYIIVESDGEIVRRLVREGHRVIFGDVTRKEILVGSSVHHARLLVVVISEPQATRTAVRLARALNPSLYIIVRTRHIVEVDELMRLGANEVIPEEFETSIEILTRTLDRYHIPHNVIHAQIQILRDENYSMLRGLPQTARGLDRVAQLLTAGTSDTFLVTDTCLAANKTISEVDLPGATGASLIAVVRNEKAAVTPPPDYLIQPGDILVLVGNHANMDKAFDYLSRASSPQHRQPRKEPQ